MEGCSASRATAGIRFGLEHHIIEHDLVRVQIFNSDFENAFEVIAILRLIRTGVMAKSLDAVRHPMIVLVALFPFLRLR